jgi:hypothetical protein
VIRTGKLVVDLDARAVEVDSQPLHLDWQGIRHFQAVSHAQVHKGITLTEAMFLDHLYAGVDEPEVQIIYVLVCKLRKKLARVNADKHYIETARGLTTGCATRVNHDPHSLGSTHGSRQKSTIGRSDASGQNEHLKPPLKSFNELLCLCVRRLIQIIATPWQQAHALL